MHIYDDRIEAFLGATLVAHHPRARGRDNGHRVHVVNYHHVIHALRRKPQALCNSVYRDNLFPRTEYAEAWKVLQRDLPRRDACRRMVDLLFLAAKSLVNGPARPNWRICSPRTLPTRPCQILRP